MEKFERQEETHLNEKTRRVILHLFTIIHVVTSYVSEIYRYK